MKAGRAGASPPSQRLRGEVILVGAGPGDPELITVRGQRALRRADVVLYDRLVDRRLLREAPPSAERIDVGKAPGRHRLSQVEICRLLVRRAREGRVVVRLKGGDPFVFGRGSEEVAACEAAGVPCQVVPGLTSAVAAPAAAGIPVTHRGLASSFTVVTAHQAADIDPIDWPALARVDTLVILMGVSRLSHIAANLLRAGRQPQTPVALIERATWLDQRIHRWTLETLAEQARAADVEPPATIIVGAVAELGVRGQGYAVNVDGMAAVGSSLGPTS